MRSYYDILGIGEGAPPDEIKRAYRRLARRFHPDLAGEEGVMRFNEVRQAYETLSDERRRRSYDARLAAGRRPPLVPSGGDDPWFRDEVAIDFPSIAPVVERMRDAFLASDEFSGPLHADILLTPREAYEGADVPLDVPVRAVCSVCGGRGEVWLEMCPTCAGSGEIWFQHRVRLSVPAGVRPGSRFCFSIGAPSAPPVRVEVFISIS